MTINYASLARRDRLLENVDIVALDAQAVRISVEAASRAEIADMSRPTPCDGWSLRDLLTHMAIQHYGFAGASRGDSDPALWTPWSLGDDPVTGYRLAAEHVLAAFATDGATDRRFPLPEIATDQTFRGSVAISFHFIDYVVHAWDVARTLGNTVRFTPELLDVATVVAEAVPTGETRRIAGAVFKPVVPWPQDSRLDHIVAILGRHPSWPDITTVK